MIDPMIQTAREGTALAALLLKFVWRAVLWRSVSNAWWCFRYERALRRFA